MNYYENLNFRDSTSLIRKI